jgi:hypothetical protein
VGASGAGRQNCSMTVEHVPSKLVKTRARPIQRRNQPFVPSVATSSDCEQSRAAIGFREADHSSDGSRRGLAPNEIQFNGHHHVEHCCPIDGDFTLVSRSPTILDRTGCKYQPNRCESFHVLDVGRSQHPACFPQRCGDRRLGPAVPAAGSLPS